MAKMMQPTMAPELENTLVAHPGVRDGIALVRETQVGSREVVLYVVPNGPFDAEALVSYVRATHDISDMPVSAVPVPAVPLDADGRVDRPMLAKLPVVDRTSVREWEEYLRATQGIEEVIVAADGPASPRPAVLHLGDLLPEVMEPPAKGEDRRTPEEATAAGPTSSARPAESDGGRLQAGRNAPVNLCATLHRAAAQDIRHGITYVQLDGCTTAQSYSELLGSAERVLAGLKQLGLRPGDRALFQFKDNRDFLTAFWGCILSGVIPVPVAVAPTYAESNAATHKLAAAWEMLGQPIILTNVGLAGPIREFANQRGMTACRVAALEDLERCPPEHEWWKSRPDDVAVIMLTSGSTGVPKGVQLTHANLLARSAGSVQMNGFTKDETTLNWMPLDHVAGILFFHLRDVYLGCRQVHCPTEVILGDPLRWLDLIDQHRCTITFAPNFAYGLVNAQAGEIQRRRWDLSSMRFVLNGAEPIVARTAREFMSLLIPHGLAPTAMYPAWGMSETSSGVTYSHSFSLESVRDEDSFVEVGRPIPGVAFRVIDDSGAVVGEGEVGHLEVKGTTVTPGYSDDALNVEAFTEDGWFRTGDLAFLRAGALTITGRAKDVIIINSVNYYSHELEAVVEEIPGITRSFTAACAVRDRGDDTDKLALFFHTALRSEAELLDLLAKVRQSLVHAVGVNPDYLLPVERSDIPKTEIGKIQRPLLVKRFGAGAFNQIRKRVDLLTQNEHTIPDWFFRRMWLRSERRRPGKEAKSGTWAVFVDAEGLGDAVCRLLDHRNIAYVKVEPGREFERRGEGSYVVDPADGDHYRRVAEELSGRGDTVIQTVHLWTIGGERVAGADGGEVIEAAMRGIGSILHWIQALAGVQRGEGRVGLLVAGSGAQVVRSGDTVAVPAASILGIVKTAQHELPWLECRHVDLEVEDASETAEVLVREATAMTPESEVAYRDGKRFIPRLAKAEFAPSREPPALRRGGRYVLSGGLGGVGVEIAKVLLQRFEARLLLLSRTPVRANGAGDAQETKTVDESLGTRLAALGRLPGTVRYAAVDVCDAMAVRRAVEAAEAEWEAPVDGVMHLAGVYEECSLVQTTPANIEAALRPKLLGGLVLAELLEQRPTAFFVAFSSVITFFGGAMAGAYTAANLAVEALVQRLTRDGHERSACTAWSRWLDVGISRGFKGLGLLEAKGYRPMTVREGIQSLLVALQQNRELLYIGLDGSSGHVRASMNTLDLEGYDVIAFCAGDTKDGPAAEILLRDRFGNTAKCARHQLAALPRDETGAIDRSALPVGGSGDGRDTSFEIPGTDLERRIAEVWSKFLRRESLDVRDSFFDLGGNSILMAQVNSALRAALGREVSLTDMFQYPTIRSLAEYLGNGPSSVEPALVSSQDRGAVRRARMRARRQGSRAK